MLIEPAYPTLHIQQQVVSRDGQGVVSHEGWSHMRGGLT